MAEFVCPICNGATWVIDDNGDAIACTCRANRVRNAKTRGLITGIPKRFAGVGLSDDGREITSSGRALNFPPDVTRAALKYTRTIDEQIENGKGLWFEGDTGTGKTTLAMLVSKAVLKSGHSVAIYSMPRLLAEIRNTFDASSTSSYAQLFAKLTAVDMLHLDDVGAEQQTEWVLEQFYAIVNERYEDGRPVMITTNLQGSELREQISQRTFSRLIEICGDPLQLYGEDRRLVVEMPKKASASEPFDSPQDEPVARRISEG
jgi:DNA replication protein DnaC